MSTYYDYYLEQKTSDGWQQLETINPKESKGSKMIYWHSGSYGNDFVDNYVYSCLSFQEYSIEAQEHYQSKYEKVESGVSHWDAWYPTYYQMDLKAMIQDYKDGIHEYDGIISKNQLLKLKRNPEYNPIVIEPKDFNKLTSKIQENYLYYAWDTPWSEYGHIYDIVPIVLKMLEHYNLSLQDVRLTYAVC